MLCYSNHFGETTFKTNSPFQLELTDLPQLVSYKELNDHLCYIFLQSIQQLDEIENKQLLLSTAYIFILEHLDKTDTRSVNFVTKFVSSILSKLTSQSWPLPVVLSSISFFINLGSFARMIPSYEVSLSFSFFFLFTKKKQKKTMSKEIIEDLCKLIVLNCDTKKSKSVPPPELITGCLFAILAWTVNGQFLLHDKQLLQKVMEVMEITIHRTLGSENSFHQMDEKVENAARYVLFNLLIRLGHYSDLSILSSAEKEKDIMEREQLTSKNVTYFIFDDELLSVIRYPRVNNSIKVTVIIRNLSGRFVWNLGLNYFPPVIPKVKTPPSESENFFPSITPQETRSEAFLKVLTDFLDEAEERAHTKILSETVAREKKQSQMLAEREYKFVLLTNTNFFFSKILFSTHKKFGARRFHSENGGSSLQLQTA